MIQFGVFSLGGPIGQSATRLISTFTDKKEASIKAKGLNASLSLGEKKYYGMKYTVRAVSV